MRFGSRINPISIDLVNWAKDLRRDREELKDRLGEYKNILEDQYAAPWMQGMMEDVKLPLSPRLITMVFSLQYSNDPVKVIENLYNQLQVGGFLVFHTDRPIHEIKFSDGKDSKKLLQPALVEAILKLKAEGMQWQVREGNLKDIAVILRRDDDRKIKFNLERIKKVTSIWDDWYQTIKPGKPLIKLVPASRSEVRHSLHMNYFPGWLDLAAEALETSTDQFLAGKILNGGIESNMFDTGINPENLVSGLRKEGRDIVGISPQVEDTPENKERGYYRGTIQAIPFPDSTFDLFVSVGLLDPDYWGIANSPEDYPQVAAEILRVLKPGGKVVINAYGPVDNKLLQAMENAGFKRVPVLEEDDYYWVAPERKSEMRAGKIDLRKTDFGSVQKAIAGTGERNAKGITTALLNGITAGKFNNTDTLKKYLRQLPSLGAAINLNLVDAIAGLFEFPSAIQPEKLSTVEKAFNAVFTPELLMQIETEDARFGAAAKAFIQQAKEDIAVISQPEAPAAVSVVRDSTKPFGVRLRLQLDLKVWEELLTKALAGDRFSRDYLITLVIKEGAMIANFQKNPSFYVRALQYWLDFKALADAGPYDLRVPENVELAKKTAAHLLEGEAVGYRTALAFIAKHYRYEEYAAASKTYGTGYGMGTFVDLWTSVKDLSGTEWEKRLKTMLFAPHLGGTPLLEIIGHILIAEGLAKNIGGQISIESEAFNFLLEPAFLRSEMRIEPKNSIKTVALALAPVMPGEIAARLIDQKVVDQLIENYERNEAELRAKLMAEIEVSEKTITDYLMNNLDAGMTQVKMGKRQATVAVAVPAEFRRGALASEDDFMNGFLQGLSGSEVKELLKDGTVSRNFEQGARALEINLRSAELSKPVVLYGDETNVPAAILSEQSKIDSMFMAVFVKNLDQLIKKNPDAAKWLGKLTSRSLIYLEDLSQDEAIKALPENLRAAKLREELLKRLNLFEPEFESLIKITQQDGHAGFEIDSLQAELVFEALAQRALATAA